MPLEIDQIATVLGRLSDPLGNEFLLAFAAVMTGALTLAYLATWYVGRGVVRAA